jgi:hypothetical protein
MTKGSSFRNLSEPLASFIVDMLRPSSCGQTAIAICPENHKIPDTQTAKSRQLKKHAGDPDQVKRLMMRRRATASRFTDGDHHWS